MTVTDTEFESTVKEFVNRLTTIENEITLLRQDRSELFAEMKEKLDIKSFRAALKIYKIQTATPDQHSLHKILTVLETQE